MNTSRHHQRSNNRDSFGEEYIKETNLAHLISRVGSASSRSFENKARLVRKKVPKLTKPIDAALTVNDDDDFINPKYLSKMDHEFIVRPETRNNVMKKNKEELLTRVKCVGEEFQEIFKNNSMPLKPLIHFFKFLVPKPAGMQSDQSNLITRSKLLLPVPYTVIYGIEENPVLYYTCKEGFVVRVDNPSQRTIKQKLTHNVRSENDLTVVVKRPLIGETVTNLAGLLNVKQLNELLENQSQGTAIFQRYVKCKGSKACLTRVIWSSCSPSTGYMMSNKKSMFDPTEKEPSKRLLINTDLMSSLHVYQMQASATRSLEVVVERIVKHIHNTFRPRVHISEMAVDFIRDEAGVYWFLQVKAIKLDHSMKTVAKVMAKDNDEDELVGTSKRKSGYMRLKECKMCFNQYPLPELSYSMSLKMIFATEKHLKRRSVKLAWFDRPEFNTIKDTSTWYQTHKVCKNCFDMYLQEQKLAKIEVQFAKAIGIPVDDEAHDNASILKNMQDGMRIKNRFKRVNSKTEATGPETLIMYRFITYLNELRNIPELLPSKFNLRFTIFGNETVVPLKLDNMNLSRVIEIGKLRVFYFFVKNDDSFRKWIHQKKRVTINLCIGDEVAGYATLLLNQFASNLIDKLDYMVLFSSSKLNLCSLRATMGFVQMRTTDVSNIQLEEYQPGIFIPPPDFFTADPLPDEWMETIPRLSIQPTTPKRPSSARSTSSASSLRQRPSSASVLQRTKSLLATKTLDELLFSQKTARKEYSQRPASASQVLNRRVKSARRLSDFDSTQFNLSHTKQRAQTGTRPRPASAGSSRYKSFGVNITPIMTNGNGRIHAWKKVGAADSTASSPKNSEKGEDNLSDIGSPIGSSASDDLKHLPKYGSKDYVWLFTIKVPSVHEMESKVDDTWIMSYSLFNVVKRQYESFHMFSDGPLLFDVEEEYFLISTEESLSGFFGRERLFKLVFTPKYSSEGEHVAAIDLRQLQKSMTLEQDVPVDRIRSDEVDESKFLEEDDDDQFVDDEEEQEPDSPIDTRKIETNAKVKVMINVRKLGRMLDLEKEAVDEIVTEATVEEFNITILQGKPFQIQSRRSSLKPTSTNNN